MNNALIGFLVAAQLLITMLFYPLRIGAFGHVSLARDKLDLNVSVLGLAVAKIRIKRENGRFGLFINGKPFKPTKRLSLKQIKSICMQYKIEGLKIRGNMLALVGAQDARNTAMLCAGMCGIATPLMRSACVYVSATQDVFELDGRLKIKINILQIVGLIFAGL